MKAWSSLLKFRISTFQLLTSSDLSAKIGGLSAKMELLSSKFSFYLRKSLFYLRISDLLIKKGPVQCNNRTDPMYRINKIHNLMDLQHLILMHSKDLGVLQNASAGHKNDRCYPYIQCAPLWLLLVPY